MNRLTKTFEQLEDSNNDYQGDFSLDQRKHLLAAGLLTVSQRDLALNNGEHSSFVILLGIILRRLVPEEVNEMLREHGGLDSDDDFSLHEQRIAKQYQVYDLLQEMGLGKKWPKIEADQIFDTPYEERKHKIAQVFDYWADRVGTPLGIFLSMLRYRLKPVDDISPSLLYEAQRKSGIAEVMEVIFQ